MDARRSGRSRGRRAVGPLALAVLAGCAGQSAGPRGDTAPVVASSDPQVIERGRYLVHGPAHCVDCHRTSPGGDPGTLGGGRVFELGPLGSFTAANLSADADAGLGGWRDEEIARVLTDGRTRAGRRVAPLMEYDDLARSDVQAIVSYLRTLPPSRRHVPSSEPSWLGRLVLTLDLLPEPPPLPADASHGQYLVDAVANGDGCHTRRSYATGRRIGAPYAGGMTLRDGGTEYVTPDISRTGAAGRLDERQFVALFRAARPRDAASPMPWHAFASMTDEDLRAIHRHLVRFPVVEPAQTGTLQGTRRDANAGVP